MPRLPKALDRFFKEKTWMKTEIATLYLQSGDTKEN
jgi:hypothetical protein